MNPEIWAVLDIAPVRDRDAIRRAYARRLKVTSPEDDAEAFRALRESYEAALASLDWDWAWQDDVADEDGDGPFGDETLVADTRVLEAVIAPAQLDAILDGSNTPRLFTAAPIVESDGEHARQIQALERLVLGQTAAEPAVLEAALAAILTSPSMEAVAVSAHTEQWIAHFVVHHAPRTDPLVRPLINAFGWSRDRVRLRHDDLVEAVLARDADIIFRDGVLRHKDLRSAALSALMRPLSPGPAWHDRFWPGFEAAMRELLAEIDTGRPSLWADLDPAPLGHWKTRLKRPRLSPGLLWMAGLAPLLPALIWMLATGRPLAAAGAYAAGVAGLLAALSAWIFGLLPERRRWRDHWAWRAPLWARAGWAPLSLGLLVLAGFLPDSPFVTAGVAIVSAGLALWAVVTGEIETTTAPGAWPLPMQILVGQGLLVAWWIFVKVVAPEAAPGPLTAAFAGAVVCSAAGTTILPALWYRWTAPVLRFVLALALFGEAAWAALEAYGLHKGAGDPALAVMATSAVVLAHRPAAAGLGTGALQWRLRAMSLALFGLSAAAPDLGWLAASCLWLLVGVAASLVGVVLLERKL